MPNRPKPQCPKCGGTKVIPIVYGFPSPGWEAKVERGEMVLGGCVTDGEEPDWECSKCSHQFVSTSKKNMI
jgi:hypothetical protein